MKKLRMILTITIIIAAAVLWAGCTGTTVPPADLKYQIDPQTSLEYCMYTAVSGQNVTTESQTLVMSVSERNGDLITWDAGTRNPAADSTAPAAPFRFSMNSRGILSNLPPEKQMIVNMMTFPNTLVYPESPVRAGDTWQYSPAYQGTMNVSDIPVEYRYTAENTFTYQGTAPMTVAAGTFDCSHILHTGKSRLTFMMPIGNQTVITTIEGNYHGDNWVTVREGYLVKSGYETDTTTIIDASSMTGDPMGLSMMGSTSHSQTSAELQR